MLGWVIWGESGEERGAEERENCYGGGGRRSEGEERVVKERENSERGKEIKGKKIFLKTVYISK